MDENAAGLDQVGQLEDGVGLSLREVRLVDDVATAACETGTKPKPDGPEIGG